MATTIEVKIYETPKKTVKGLAKKLFKITTESTQQQFHIALSGGKTPGLLFDVLAAKYNDLLPWEKIHLWWGDERCVDPESKESNFRLAFDKLISHVEIGEKNIHRIKGEENPKAEAERYNNEITSFLNMRGDWPVFDLVILGLGEDGHTASIFPGHLDLLDFPSYSTVAEHPITGQKRVTLTGKVLNNSSRIFFLVTGENKAGRISEIMNDDHSAKLLPAYYIQPENGELTWYIDQDAASLIS